MGRRSFTPYTSGRGYKQGSKIFGSVIGTGLKVGGSIANEAMKSTTSNSAQQSTAEPNSKLDLGGSIIAFVISLAISIGLIILGFSIGWSIIATIGVFVLIAPIMQIKEWVSSGTKTIKEPTNEQVNQNIANFTRQMELDATAVQQENNSNDSRDNSNNAHSQTSTALHYEYSSPAKIINTENPTELSLITAEAVTNLLDSLGDYKLPEDILSLPNESLYWYLRGVKSVRDNIKSGTQSALNAKRKRGEAIGGDVEVWGKKQSHVKDLSEDERAEYRENCLIKAQTASAEARRAKAMANQHNIAFWHFMQDYKQIVQRTSNFNFEDIAKRANERGLKTSSGLEFSKGRAAAMYSGLKKIFG